MKFSNKHQHVPLKRHMMRFHFVRFTGFIVHHSSSVTFFPLTLAFFSSAVLKFSLTNKLESRLV